MGKGIEGYDGCEEGSSIGAVGVNGPGARGHSGDRHRELPGCCINFSFCVPGDQDDKSSTYK